MRRRIFYVILSIILLFASIDVNAFAMEGQECVEKQGFIIVDLSDEIVEDVKENILEQQVEEIVLLNLKNAMVKSFSSIPTYYGYNGNGGDYSAGCFIYSIAMLLQNAGISMTPAQVYADNSNSVEISSWGKLNTKYKNSYKVQITDRVYISGEYNEKLAKISEALDNYPTGIMIGFAKHMAYAFKLNGEV